MLLCYGVLTFVLPVFWIFLSEINLFNYWKIQREVASLEFSTYKHTYRKVASSRLSWLVAHLRLFRLFMKRKFDAYLLWPLANWVWNWIEYFSWLYSSLKYKTLALKIIDQILVSGNILFFIRSWQLSNMTFQSARGLHIYDLWNYVQLCQFYRIA